MDNASYEVFKNCIGIAHIDELRTLIEAAYFLDFNGFKECCLCALACDFFISNSEEDL